MMLSKKLSKEFNSVTHSRQTADSQWDSAIRDAEMEVELLVRQQSRLRQAIRIFKQNKSDGMQWPGFGTKTRRGGR